VELEKEVVGIQNGESEVNENLYPLIGCAAAAIIILCAIASLLLLRQRKQRKRSQSLPNGADDDI